LRAVVPSAIVFGIFRGLIRDLQRRRFEAQTGLARWVKNSDDPEKLARTDPTEQAAGRD
jgi:hypothetical protein